MIELRWLVRGGERCLQYRTRPLITYDANGICWSDWQDVPVVEEGE